MTTDKLKGGHAPKPATKPSAKPAARPAPKAPPKAGAPKPPAWPGPLGPQRQAAPSQAFMPRGVNWGNVQLPDNTRTARRYVVPTFQANRARAQAVVKQPKPGLLGRLWGEVKNVGRGAVDAVVDAGKGIYQVVRHPVQTAKALVHLAKNPKEIVTVAKTMWHDATKHGVGYAIGYIGANLAPTLLTGGGTGVGVAGRVLAVAGKTRTLQVLARTPAVARTLARVGKVGGKVAKVTDKVARIGDQVGDAAKATKAGRALVKTSARAKALRSAIAEQRYVRPVAKAYRIAKQPVEQVRKLRQRLQDKVVRHAEDVVRKADKAIWANPKTGGVARKLDLEHRVAPANPRFEAQVQALGAKIDEIRGGQAVTGPGRRGAAEPLHARYDRVLEDLALNDPARLAAIQRKAFQEVGFTPKEQALWDDAVHSWTNEMGSRGVGRFAKLDDFHAYFREANRLYETTGDAARAAGETGVYAKAGGSFGKHLAAATRRVDPGFLAAHRPSPAQLAELQELVEIVAKVRGTRAARREAIGRELGLPPIDASHLPLYRGTSYHAGVKGVFDAWKAGDDTFKTWLRQAESFSADFEVASDFSLGGWRSAGTQGREAAEGSVVFWIDAPRERVITDKYVDIGAHAYREAAQRSQMEYVLQFADPHYKVPADQAVIQFKGEFYGRADLARLEAAIAADPAAWARVTTPPPQP